MEAFLQQQGSHLVLALLKAAGDSCPAQLLRALSLLLHALLHSSVLKPGQGQLLRQILAMPDFPGTLFGTVITAVGCSGRRVSTDLPDCPIVTCVERPES